MVILPCVGCQKPVECTGKTLYMSYRKRAFCSEECRKKEHSERSSRTMAATNRKHASARMKARNPMRREEIRAKVSTTLRAMAWKPPVHGGNGKGPTAPQLALAAALGWPMEQAIRTGTSGREGAGYPSCYKVDIANPVLKVAIEVDGNSHNTEVGKARDAKKDAFLAGLGWRVLRFSNERVTEDLEGCVREVLSSISKSKGITTTS